MKYRYDIDLHSTKTGKKLKTLYSQITGAESKKFQSQIKDMPDAREIRIYRTSTYPNGKTSRSLYKVKTYGIEEDIYKTFDRDFYYAGVEVKYEMEYNCENNYCNEEGICRCGRMVDVEVESIDVSYAMNTLINEILKMLEPYKLKISREILVYCLDRTLRPFLSYSENYNIDYGPSYYGDEIRSVKFMGSKQLARIVANIVRMSSADAIKYVLEQEYGYLLEDIKQVKSCKVKEIRSCDIKVPNKEHYVKLDKNIIEDYKDYPYPIGVYKSQNGHYRLIDGYHRYKAFEKSNERKCKVVVIE